LPSSVILKEFSYFSSMGQLFDGIREEFSVKQKTIVSRDMENCPLGDMRNSPLL